MEPFTSRLVRLCLSPFMYSCCSTNHPLAGLRPALVGAGIGTAAAAGWSAFKNFV